MKISLLAGAALATSLISASAMAATTPSGYVGAFYSYAESGGANADSFSAEAAIAGSVGDSGLGFQLDGVVSGDDSDTDANATFHLFNRSETLLFGAYSSIGSIGDDMVWGGGLEVQSYHDNMTFTGVVGYAKDEDINVDGWGVGGQAGFFASDNTRFDVGAAWANVSGIGSTDVYSIGAGVEHKFDSSPVSVLASYNYVDVGGANANVFMIGVRLNGGSTLRERDHSGPSLSSSMVSNLIG